MLTVEASPSTANGCFVDHNAFLPAAAQSRGERERERERVGLRRRGLALRPL